MFINVLLLVVLFGLVTGFVQGYRWWRGDYNTKLHEYDCDCMKEFDLDEY